MSDTSRQESMMEVFKRIYGLANDSKIIQVLGPIFYIPASDTCVIHAPEGFYDKDSAWDVSFVVRDLNAKKDVDPVKMEFDFVTEDRRTVLKSRDEYSGAWVDMWSVGKVSGGWILKHEPSISFFTKMQVLMNVVDHHRKAARV